MLKLDQVIDFLQECQREYGDEIAVVISGDDLREPGDFIALDQIPGILPDA